MPTGRIVAFRIYDGEQVVIEGKFFVSADAGVSTFGEYRGVEVAGVTAPIFEGVVINHNLDGEGGVELELEMYAVDATGKIPRQSRVLRAGLSFDPEAGERGSESVMLSDTYELVYQTVMVGEGG